MTPILLLLAFLLVLDVLVLLGHSDMHQGSSGSRRRPSKRQNTSATDH
jgi:hypothetical protein